MERATQYVSWNVSEIQNCILPQVITSIQGAAEEYTLVPVTSQILKLLVALGSLCNGIIL